MITLAVDTSGYAGGVAILDDLAVLGEITLANRQTYSHNLVASMECLMEKTGTDWGAIDLLAVTTGPGSFTGLRIGLATVKGLAFARSIPVCGVPTLDARAAAVRAIPGEIICPVIDARKKQIFTACYQAGEAPGSLERITEYLVMDPDRLHEIIPAGTSGLLLFGNGLDEYLQLIEDSLDIPYATVPEYVSLPRASSAGWLAAYRMIKGGKPDDPAGLVPLYVRPSEAEIAREKKLPGNNWKGRIKWQSR